MRKAGVLLPISSLPSPWGIGALGAAAREFIDFLAAAGQSFWQILPLGPTSYGDSPYQSFSSWAGNPYFIDLDDLAAEGLLERQEYQRLNWGEDPARVDYGLLYKTRYPVLRKACPRTLLPVRRSGPAAASICPSPPSGLEPPPLPTKVCPSVTRPFSPRPT